MLSVRAVRGDVPHKECPESSGQARTLRLRHFHLYVRVKFVSSDSKNMAAGASAVRKHAAVNL